MPPTCHVPLPWLTLPAAAAVAAAGDDTDEDGSTQDSEGNDQGLKVHWITQGDK